MGPVYVRGRELTEDVDDSVIEDVHEGVDDGIAEDVDDVVGGSYLDETYG